MNREPPSPDDLYAASGSQPAPARMLSEIGVADYQAMLLLLSARVCCFAFDDVISVELPPHEIVERMWTTPSRCIEANQFFARSMGESSAYDTLGKSFGRYFPPTITTKRLLKRWVENNFYLSKYEWSQLHENGDRSWFETSLGAVYAEGGISRLWLLSRDVTERRELLQSLRDAEHHYRTLVERPGLMIARTRPDGHYLYVSPHVRDIFGYGPEDFNAIPQLFTTLLHPDDTARHAPVLEARRRHSAETVEVEYRARHTDGSYHWFLERQTPKLSPRGEVEYYDSVALDINDRKQLEAQLRHAQRMEVIGTIAGSIAHDFNNQLTAVLGQMNLAARHLGADHPATQHLVIAERAARVCGEITRQLLSFSRKGDLHLAPLRLDTLLDEIETLLRHLLPRSIALTIDKPASLPGVRGNVPQLQQVMMNLALNARDAMPHGGTLMMSSTLLNIERGARHPRYPMARPGAYVEIVVADTGSGIAPELLPRIFEPFFTTKERSHGTGLGLSSVYAIVRAHGGWITLRSTPGVRTEFSLIVPSCEAPPVPVQQPAPPESQRGNGELILVAEDDQPVREMIRAALEINGYRVVEAASGDELRERFEMLHREVGLVLIDGSLSLVGNHSLIRTLRARTPNVPVIVASGEDTRAARAEMQTSHAYSAFLSKPYTLHDLFVCIRKQLDGYGAAAA